LYRDGIKPEPVRLKAEIRSLPQASHFKRPKAVLGECEVGLHNSNLSHILSCLFIGSGDVARHKYNRQLLLSPLGCVISNFLF